MIFSGRGRSPKSYFSCVVCLSRFSSLFHTFWCSSLKIILKQLFALGEVNIGEYLPRLQLGKYSPIFASPSASNC